jgi:hypothetical protein
MRRSRRLRSRSGQQNGQLQLPLRLLVKKLMAQSWVRAQQLHRGVVGMEAGGAGAAEGGHSLAGGVQGEERVEQGSCAGDQQKEEEGTSDEKIRLAHHKLA